MKFRVEVTTDIKNYETKTAYFNSRALTLSGIVRAARKALAVENDVRVTIYNVWLVKKYNPNIRLDIAYYHGFYGIH